MKLLITGADGFIGSHLTEAMVRAGHDVKAFVLYNSFNSWGWLDQCSSDVQGKFEVFCGDVRDPNGVRNAMQGCSQVMHLAALIGIPYSYHSPDTYIETNVKGTLNILQAARDAKIDRLVHTSTSEVYGSAQFVPITEAHPLQAQSPYSASKIAADQLAYSFYSSFDMPISIIRPFNTYGPRQSLRAVIPAIVSQILNGNIELELGAIEPTRDFSFVKDTVSGFDAVLRAENSIGEVVNIGSGYEISIKECVNLIAGIMDVEVTIQQDLKRLRPEKSEVDRLWADNSKAKELCNWAPHYVGIEGLKKGLVETIDWFSDPENYARYKSRNYVI